MDEKTKSYLDSIQKADDESEKATAKNLPLAATFYPIARAAGRIKRISLGMMKENLYVERAQQYPASIMLWQARLALLTNPEAAAAWVALCVERAKPAKVEEEAQ